MKRSTSFRLSAEAVSGLRQLAERYGFSQAAVLERLILDRVSSSDRMKNSERRRRACKKALERVWGSGPLFLAGYNSGWLDFQTRHGDESLIETLPTE